MTIRTILVPVRGDGKGDGVLDHAVALGRPFAAHLDIVHCRARPEDLMPYGSLMLPGLRETIVESAAAAAQEEEDKLHELFDTYCREHDLANVDHPPGPDGKLSVSWREETGKMSSVVAVRGRLADLIAVAQPDRENQIGHNTLEAALLETGKMVLMCPPLPATTIGTSVAVAWNGSAEAARAVTSALSLLTQAKSVTVLSAAAGSPAGLGPDALIEHLGWHGINATARELDAKGTEVGQTLLATARDADADVLLMGGYGHSRRRELIMGGVTQHIIEAAEMPVILVH